MQIKSIQKEIHQVAKDKGFWDEPRNDGEMICLMHSELSEALEALRHKDQSQNNVGEELADCVIRILDYCEARDIDLEKEISTKVEKNKLRPYKHGKKF